MQNLENIGGYQRVCAAATNEFTRKIITNGLSDHLSLLVRIIKPTSSHTNSYTQADIKCTAHVRYVHVLSNVAAF